MKHRRPHATTQTGTVAPTPSLVPTASEPSRYPLLYGVLLGLFMVAFFIYPAGAYPLQSLLLSAIMLAAAVGLTAKHLAQGGPGRTAILSALGSLPVLSGFLFILWAVARWRFAEVPALERDWIVSLLGMGVALALGCAVGAQDRVEPTGPAGARVFIRIITMAALGFGLYAIYQYAVAYPHSYAELKAQLGSSATNLNDQSLLHALQERRVGGKLGNPNLFAAQLAAFAFLALSSIGRERQSHWKMMGILGAVAALAGALVSQSRGGLLTMFLALGGAALLLASGHRSKSNPAAPSGLTILALGFAIIALSSNIAWARHESLLQRIGNISTIRERLFYWQIALKVWARHPFIGEGPGGFPLLYLTLKSPIARESQYAHSWFFQVGAELGLVGLIPLVLFYAGSALRVCGAWRRRPLDPEAPWLLGALLILGFNGLFEFSMQWHTFLVTAGMLAGLVSGLTVTPGPLATTQALPSPAARVRGGASLALAAAIALLALILAPPLYLAENQQEIANSAATDDPPRWFDAADAYARAVRLLPDDPNFHMAYAAALGRLGREQEAWGQIEEAMRLNPRSAAVRATQAQWLDRQGRLPEALRKMGEAIERYPSNVQYRLDRTRLNLKATHAEAARADLSFIEQSQLPVWEYQQPGYLKLRAEAGLPPVASIPQ